MTPPDAAPDGRGEEYGASARERRSARWRRRRARARDRARKGLAILPSLLTLGNMLCGFYAIVHVASVQWKDGVPTPANAFQSAAIAILVAMIFDMLDGRVARMTRTTSDFGAQLDSLADAITFGVAPGVLVAMLHSLARYDYAQPFWSKVAWVFGAAYACGAVIRLARFNTETTSHDEEAHNSFKGLPSPAAAGVIATLVLLHDYTLSPRSARLAWIKPERFDISDFLPFVALIAGWLMVSSFRYVHFANVFLRGRKPAQYLSAVVFGGVVAALFPEPTAAVLFCGFALTGPAHAFARWMRSEPEAGAALAAAAIGAAQAPGEAAAQPAGAAPDLEGAGEAAERGAPAARAHEADDPGGAPPGAARAASDAAAALGAAAAPPG